jgi:UrcA family protein
MKTNSSFRRIGFATLGMAAGVLTIRGAIADDLDTTSVIATRSAEPSTTVIGRSDTGFPIVLVEIEHKVRFDDLDLATTAGADALIRRVSDTARKGCLEVDRVLSPQSSPSRACMNDAVSEAMPQIDSAIQEAKARASSRS